MKRLCSLFLCLALLSGCAGCSWMDGSYSSVTPHEVTPAPDPEDITQVSGYSQLRNALSDLVDSGATHGVFSLIDYPEEQASADIAMAINYTRWNNPIGAYAVNSIDYELGSSSGSNVVSVDITYRHGKTEIDRIKTVRGISGASSAVSTALRDFIDSLVLQVTDYSDTDFPQLVADYAAQHPDVVMEVPQVTAQVYPNTGDVRVVELVFSYQTSRDSLRSMQSNVKPVFSSAALYVSSDATDYTKFNQLYTFLMERFDYIIETSITPSYSLLCHGVGDSKAFAQVYAAMCRQVGLECLIVSGTHNGESKFWNIVLDGDTYYHVDLLRCAQEGGYREAADIEMSGYVWDYSTYPVCGESTEDTAASTPEQDVPTQ